MLEEWLKSYRPEELFDAHGALLPELAELAPDGRRAAWARIRTPTAGCCCATCGCPDFRDYAVRVRAPGSGDAEDTRVLGRFLRDVIVVNDDGAEFPRRSVRTKRCRIDSTPCSKRPNRQWDARDVARR